ncbi:acyl-CoA dehydrogenase family protein [Tsukamurella ocularis]|uniref:acyl-CoA dehydrogenase family protein n=1 Tax=Tsukamurella ocularis TaxID=1970234 RepID=UPI0039F06D16
MTTTESSAHTASLDDLAHRSRAFFAGIGSVLDPIPDPELRARTYQRELFAAGLTGIDVPVEYGGQGLDHMAKALVDRITRTDAPPESSTFAVGPGMAVPTILELAAESLRQRYVRPALEGTEIWCQLYSEPGAGSDLAGLQTRATRTEDGWELNGQKVWTSHAHWADMGICLARTNPDVPKHRGLTMFVVPMRAPGVTVRPITQITGDQEFNEVFFDGVRIPADHVVGEVDGGWPVAVALMQNERSSIGAGGGRQAVGYLRLAELVRSRGASADPAVRERLVDVFVGQRLAGAVDEYLAESRDGGAPLGAVASLGKLWRSDNGRLASDLIGELAYRDGTAWDGGDDRDEWTYALLDACALALGGGSDDIQRNALAEQVLGLPRDPFSVSNVPFRELRVGNTRSTPEEIR